MKPSQRWRFHSSSEKYSCSNPLINVCLADVSMETVFTAPECSKNGSKVITVPGEWNWHRYDGQWWRRVVLHVWSVTYVLCGHGDQQTLASSCPWDYLKPRERAESGTEPLLLCFCVYFSSPPTQNSWIRTTEQRFRTCESAAWKTWQLLLCLHAPHPPPIIPHFYSELKQTAGRFTHSLPQSPPLLRSCVCYINAAHHIDGILWILSRVLWRRQLLMLV